MKERSMLMSGSMVRATLRGDKMQTRRIIKRNASGRVQLGKRQWHIEDPDAVLACPFGQPKDTLWIRETYYQRGHWEAFLGIKTKTGRQKWRFVPASETILFEAPQEFRKGRHSKDPFTIAWHKRLGRFMFCKYSRITLEITGVRVERLNDISEADAMAEGVEWKDFAGLASKTARKLFKELWESINGIDSWALNPFVWIVEFKRIKP